MYGDRGIRLPWGETERIELSTLDVECGDVGWQGLLFIGKDRITSRVKDGVGVVVIGGKLLQRRLECGLADPPVKVKEVGMVFVDELSGTANPHSSLRCSS